MKKRVSLVMGLIFSGVALADVQVNLGGVAISGNNMSYQSKGEFYSSVQGTLPISPFTEIGPQFNYIMPTNSDDYSIGSLDLVMKQDLLYPMIVTPYMICKAGYSNARKSGSTLQGMNVGMGLGLQVFNLNVELQDQIHTFPGSDNNFVNCIVGSFGFNFL